MLSLSQAQLLYRAHLGLARLELDNDLLSLAQKLTKIELKKGFLGLVLKEKNRSIIVFQMANGI